MALWFTGKSIGLLTGHAMWVLSNFLCVVHVGALAMQGYMRLQEGMLDVHRNNADVVLDH